MNNVFRLIWNRTLGRLVVTSEAARSRDKAATRQGLVGQLPAPQTSSSISALLRPAVIAVALASLPFSITDVDARVFAGAANCSNANTGTVDGTAYGLAGNPIDGSGTYSTIAGCGSSGTGSLAATAVGSFSRSNAGGAALGFNAQAGNFATALGAQSRANFNRAVAIGARAEGGADYSIAIGGGSSVAGETTRALGVSSIAVGRNALSVGDQSIVLGVNAKAYENGNGGVAIGAGAKVGENEPPLASVDVPTGGVAIGVQAQAARVTSTAVGAGAKATAANAISIGGNRDVSSIASGVNSLAVGIDATASGNSSIALGFSDATKERAIAIGPNAAASSERTVALGSTAKAIGSESVAIGRNSTAQDEQTIALGVFATANSGGAIAIGHNAKAESRFSPPIAGPEFLMQSVALGAGAEATSGTAIGANAKVGDSTGGLVTGTAVGGGAQAGNAAIALSGAEYWPAKAEGNSSIAAGTNATTTLASTSAIALGATTLVDGKHSIAMGRQSQVSGERSIALGQDAKVGTYDTNGDATGSANSAIALGDFANVQGNNGIAIGKESLASVENTIAMGTGAQATGKNAMALGSGSRATGSVAIGNDPTDPTVAANGGTAVGDGAQATWRVDNNNTDTTLLPTPYAEAGVALGKNALANRSGATALGTNTEVTAFGGVALGSGSKATIAANVAGYVPAGATATESANVAGTIATRAAVDIGSRQITSVAAGTELDDAVNVAQLRASETHYFSVNDNGTQQANFNNDGASGVNALAAGTNASASGESAVAVGDGADAGSSTISAGALTGVTNPNGYAVGDNLASTAVGAGAKVVSGTAIGFDAVAGKDVGGATVNTGTAIGGGAQATGNASIAISPAAYAPAIAEGDSSIAQGLDARSPGSGSVAIGALTSAAADGGIALGASAAVDAAANSGIALGNSANVTATNGMALGASSKANADAGIALGTSATVDSTATNGIALGLSSNVTAVNGVALGAGSAATVESGVAGYVPTGATVADSTNIAGTVAALGAVDIGSRQITSVAAGTQLDDAVNVAQLVAVENIANTGWDVQVNAETADNVAPGETVQFIDGKNIEISRNADQVIEVATADEVEFTQVTIGDATNNTVITSTVDGLDVGGDKITNVQAGDLSATSTDAVNGSQLFATNTNVTNNTTEINKGLNFGDGATSNNYALGDTINVNGDANVTSTTTADGVQLGLADVLSVGSTNPVSIDGDAGTISGLTNTTFDPNATYTGGQAATQEQLTSVSNVANAGWDVQVNAETADNVAPGETVQFIDGKNIEISRNADQVIEVATADEVEFTQVTIGDATNNTVITSTVDGLDVGGDKITNVQAGDLSATSTDAVNGSQLFATNENVTTNTTNITNNAAEIDKGINFGDGATSNKYALGDTINVNGDANVTSTTTADGVQLGLADVLSVGSTNPVSIDGDAGTISGLTNTTFDPNATYTGGQAATQEQLTSVSNVANAGWDVQVNAETADNVAPGETVQFIDGKNIEISRNADQVIEVATADEVEFTQVTIGDATNNTVITSTVDGLDVGGDKITNVQAGDLSATSTDAVNGSQLFATNENVTTNTTN
uniref:ESPR-type extended signal peptide-containing protein n=1 Tax=Halomonas alkaliantarctica TaxID=232346 RepID=UPI0004AB0947